MPAWLRSKAKACLRSARGATAIEYALIAGGIAMGIAVVVFAVGDSLTDLFGSLPDQITK